MRPWESYLEQHKAPYLDELLDFLSIPSISALPERAADVARAADWVANRLASAGLERVQAMPTGVHPVVYGEWLHAPGKPTVLVYGHFDTQPVDPLDRWTNPPFEPVIRDGRVYARGASDNKGNLLLAILGVEALLKSTGRLPLNVKFLAEGQEEIGSPQLPAFIAANRELLACDLAISSDAGQWTEDQPALLVGLRGICGVQLDVYGPSADLHSGIYGGAVANPIHQLARLLDSMRSPDGKILVDGFYDDVVLTDEDRARIARVPFDEVAYRARLGVAELFGEPGYTTLERTWLRPTLEVNGIWGGFQGEGIKTVLPTEAHAKITCRLVPDQAPARIVQLISAHVARHTPPGVKVTVQPLAGMARPYIMPVEHPANQTAASVLGELYGKPPVYIRMGGSVPITEAFLKTLGAYTLSFGFGLDDEQFHAPDEFFRLASFERGQRAYCLLLERLGE